MFMLPSNGKVKNPCKICYKPVDKKTGIQCLGACRKWLHFKCLPYGPLKIQDLKDGKVKCPCPDCNNHINPRKGNYCGKSRCPAAGANRTGCTLVKLPRQVTNTVEENFPSCCESCEYLNPVEGVDWQKCTPEDSSISRAEACTTELDSQDYNLHLPKKYGSPKKLHKECCSPKGSYSSENEIASNDQGSIHFIAQEESQESKVFLTREEIEIIRRAIAGQELRDCQRNQRATSKEKLKKCKRVTEEEIKKYMKNLFSKEADRLPKQPSAEGKSQKRKRSCRESEKSEIHKCALENEKLQKDHCLVKEKSPKCKRYSERKKVCTCTRALQEKILCEENKKHKHTKRAEPLEDECFTQKNKYSVDQKCCDSKRKCISARTISNTSARTSPRRNAKRPLVVKESLARNDHSCTRRKVDKGSECCNCNENSPSASSCSTYLIENQSSDSIIFNNYTNVKKDNDKKNGRKSKYKHNEEPECQEKKKRKKRESCHELNENLPDLLLVANKLTSPIQSLTPVSLKHSITNLKPITTLVSSIIDSKQFKGKINRRPPKDLEEGTRLSSDKQQNKGPKSKLLKLKLFIDMKACKCQAKECKCMTNNQCVLEDDEEIIQKVSLEKQKELNPKLSESFLYTEECKCKAKMCKCKGNWCLPGTDKEAIQKVSLAELGNKISSKVADSISYLEKPIYSYSFIAKSRESIPVKLCKSDSCLMGTMICKFFRNVLCSMDKFQNQFQELMCKMITILKATRFN